MLLYEPLEGSGGPARLRASWRSTACASRMSTICAAAGTAQIAVCQAQNEANRHQSCDRTPASWIATAMRPRIQHATFAPANIG